MTDDFTSIALYCLCICLFPFPRCFFGICIYICISSVFVFVLHKMQMIAKTQGNNWWLLNYQIIGRAGASPLHHLDKIQKNSSFFSWDSPLHKMQMIAKPLGNNWWLSNCCAVFPFLTAISSIRAWFVNNQIGIEFNLIHNLIYNIWASHREKCLLWKCSYLLIMNSTTFNI